MSLFTFLAHKHVINVEIVLHVREAVEVLETRTISRSNLATIPIVMVLGKVHAPQRIVRIQRRFVHIFVFLLRSLCSSTNLSIKAR